MPGPRFCRLVPLLPAYGGAVAKALAFAAGPAQDPNLLPVPTAAAAASAAPAPTPITPAVAAMDRHNFDLFSFATTGGGDG